MQNWEQRYPIGAVIGFILWGLGFVTTVGMIFWDIRKRKEHYTNLVEEDIHTLKNTIQVDNHTWGDIQRDLAQRLAGTETEDKGDDQLLGEAARLSEQEYRPNLGK